MTSLSCSLTFNVSSLEDKLKILCPKQLFRRNLSNSQVSTRPTGGGHFFSEGYNVSADRELREKLV